MRAAMETVEGAQICAVRQTVFRRDLERIFTLADADIAGHVFRNAFIAHGHRRG